MQKELNLGHNTMFMLHQLKEQIEKCENISAQRQKKIMEDIKYFIQRMSQTIKIFIQGDRMISVSILVTLCDSIRDQLNNWLLEEQQNNTRDHLFQIINQNIQEDFKQSTNLQNQKQLKLTIKQQEKCHSLAFNKNVTIMFVGQNKGRIKLYGVNNNHKKIKTLKYCEGWVLRLIWMERSKLLLSSAGDSLILWNKEWKQQHILEGHSENIESIIVNEEEDLIISGSYWDEKLKFWRKINQCWICKETIQTNCRPNSLTLNPQQTKVISCGYGQINLIELNDNQQWIITQQLKSELSGQLICFISENQFVFSPDLAGFLLIFNYQKESKQFVQNQSLLISNHQSRESTSVCHFIKQTSTLILNYDKYIYFFHLDQNGVFQLFKSVNVGKKLIMGSLSDDGEFLAACDQESQDIQMIRFLSKN